MWLCGSVPQCVAVFGSVWQCAAGQQGVCCSVAVCTVVCGIAHGRVWQCVAVCGGARDSVWQCALRI
jgi:hypothetical protein